MTFANPAALFGLAAVAVPIAVHLLARHRGPRTAFPTLRFFQLDRMVALRRYQLTDLLLLGVRIVVISCAALALAGPRLGVGPAPLTRPQPAMAIVVDTSTSLSKPGPDGRPAIESARAEAARLRQKSDRATVIEAGNVRGAVMGAVAWLKTQADPRELVIISDFKRGTMATTDLATVPPAIGVHVVQTRTAVSATVSGPVVWRNDANGKLRQFTPSMTLSPDRTDVVWITGPDLTADPSKTFDLDSMLAFVARATDSRRALMALRAVMGQGSHAGSRAHPVAMVFAGAPGFGAMWDRAAQLDQPWMVDVVRQLSTSAAINDAAHRTRVNTSVDLRGDLVPVVRDADGQPLVVAGSGEVDQAHRLLLFVAGDGASLASALVMEATLRAASTDAPMSDLEPIAIDAGTLQSWERAPAAAPMNEGQPVEPVGRWVWAMVLVWLGVETWMRRTRGSATSGIGREVTRDRVA